MIVPPAWAALALACILGTVACRKPEGAGSLALALRVTPAPPSVGTASVEVTVTDAAGAPVSGGTLRLEGNMSHPGMRPSLGECRESAPGQYRGPLELTMAGDWFIEVDASFPDGRRARRTFDLPGVRPR